MDRERIYEKWMSQKMSSGEAFAGKTTIDGCKKLSDEDFKVFYDYTESIIGDSAFKNRRSTILNFLLYTNKEIFTDVAKLNALASLPEVFPPNRLMAAFRISHGFAYTLVHLPGFPAVMERDRIIVSKQGLIRWIQSNEKYIGKEK